MALWGHSEATDGTAPAMSGFTAAATTTNWTCAAWIFPLVGPSLNDCSHITGFYENGNFTTADKILGLNNALRPCGFIYPGSNVSVIGDRPVRHGEWNHVAVVANGSTFKVYLDGVEVGSVAAGASYSFSAPRLRVFGNSPPIFNAAAKAFRGAIWDLAHWNAELHAGQIAALADMGARPDDFREGLFFWTPFEGDHLNRINAEAPSAFNSLDLLSVDSDAPMGAESWELFAEAAPLPPPALLLKLQQYGAYL